MTEPIPVFALYGERGAFPDVAHVERIAHRAGRHGWTIAPHRHERMAQLFSLEDGRAEAAIDGRRMSMTPGSILYVPARAAHGFKFSPGAEGLVLSAPLAAEGAPDQPILGNTTPQLETLLTLAAEIYAETGPRRGDKLSAIVAAALAAAAEIGGARGRGKGRVAELDTLLARHMAARWRPADYAAAMSITTGQLSRICKAASGLSASAYIERAAMEEARRLLAFTRLAVAEVGYRLGYPDPSHFSRRFTARQGERPSAYRARFEDRRI